ncbi:cytochrome P450, partial [Auriculariales sp. MPI-PUGE-AT-0066]
MASPYMDRSLQRDVAVSGFIILLSIVASRILWNLKFSPIARQNIPGPWFAAAAELRFQWSGVRMDRAMWVDRLFKKYGPVVRIGPNRVVLLDSTAVHQLYRTLPFNKAEFMTLTTFGGGPNTLSTNDSFLHAKFRRWHAPALRGTRMKDTALTLSQKMEDLVSRLVSDGQMAAGVDILRLMKVHALDMLGIALFDSEFDQVRTRKELALGQYTEDYLLGLMIRTTFPVIVQSLLKMLPISRMRDIFAADDAICQFAAKLYDETPEVPVDTENMNAVAAGKWYRDRITGETVTKEEVVSEMGIFLIAGTDTTAVALTYAFYHLAQLQDVYHHLRAELKSANMSGALGNVDVLRGLPYLNAFIKEILRAHSPAGGMIERVVNDGPMTFAGYIVPEGTTVGASALASGMREDLFPHATQVNPERWVEKTISGWAARKDISMSEMNAAWHPFNLGLRACPGRQLAETEILLTITAVVMHLRIELHESMTEGSMSHIDLGLIQPKGPRCQLHFASNPLAG